MSRTIEHYRTRTGELFVWYSLRWWRRVGGTAESPSLIAVNLCPVCAGARHCHPLAAGAELERVEPSGRAESPPPPERGRND